MTVARDAAYLAHVRTHYCVFCTLKADHAHHHGKKSGGGGMGLKPSDYQTVPLCTEHHGEFHQRGQIGHWDAKETDRRFAWAMVQCLRSWIER